MKVILGLFLSAISFCCSAQPLAIDGNWIRNSINAFDRVNVTRNGTTDDTMDSIAFISYVGGILAVHRQNNLMASLLVSSLVEQKKASKSAATTIEIEKQMRVAFAFVPLLAIPENLSTQQVAAVLRKYLDANPEKWNLNAHILITDALKEAFSKK